jgi:hypothetical protein
VFVVTLIDECPRRQAARPPMQWSTAATGMRMPAQSGQLRESLTHEVIPPFDLTFSLLMDIGWN